MENLILLGFVGAVVALIFAFIQRGIVMKHSEGNDKMVEIAQAIRDGANAYLKHQYMTVGKVFAVVFVILLIMAFATNGEMLSKFTPFAFITGGVFSMLAGFIGMKIATNSNARTAQAAYEGLNKGLRVAFSSGSVMGFTVVGLGMLDVTMWFCILHFAFGITDPVELGNIMVMNGMGASFMALFARVGGGIYTKAADVGADLVGKVEAGIPEDDPRNPATIADNVGDNVGDVAGMGADLYESYVGSILATFALSATAGYGFKGMVLPLMIAVTGMLCSLIGSFMVKTKEDADQKSLLKTLRTGTYSAAVLAAICAAVLTYVIMGNMGIFVAILCGLIGGCAIGYFTEYYTSDTYKPTQALAAASETGSATIIIGGISLGLKSTASSILIVGAAVLISYFAAGGSLTIVDEAGAFTAAFNQGLYGIGIAGVGMLSTLGITLATDAYGPVADNAGGIAEMAELPEFVRDRTDALDSLGNTTAATGKGFAIGSASLTALALLVSYVSIVQAKTTDEVLNFSLTSPTVLVGLFIGAMLTFVFSAFTMGAVQTAAQTIVTEVRRQFKEIPGIMEYKAKPDYQACVGMCTKGALKEMVVPALLAIIVPIATGLILGPTGVVGLLGGVSVTGFAMAVFMSNAGGAWDNAKKYIERGNHGGKGSEQHKAAVVGDTVGDPFKDTSGPSLNILIKLVSTVSIVFSGLIVTFNLIGLL